MALLASGCTAQRPVLTARALLADPAQYDGTPIVLVGQVQQPRKRMPAEGNAYTSFVLADGTGRVPVFGWSVLDIDSGDLLEVRGTFRREQPLGGEIVRNTVEADFVRRLRAASQPRGAPVGPP
jgi:hypothetical protein